MTRRTTTSRGSRVATGSAGPRAASRPSRTWPARKASAARNVPAVPAATGQEGSFAGWRRSVVIAAAPPAPAAPVAAVVVEVVAAVAARVVVEVVVAVAAVVVEVVVV